MAAKPLLTVAICTHNRATLLPEAIKSILSQTFSDFELLIIDNHSTDNTKNIAASYQANDKRIRYVYEGKLGIAAARNRAIAETQGEFLAFLDDDAVATPSWLSLHFAALQGGYQAAVGRVEVNWCGKKPFWFPEKYETLYAKYDYGLSDCDLPKGAHLITTNASFSKKFLQLLGGFNEKLGHQGRKLVGGEDIDLYQKIEAKEIPIRYLSQALVLHNAEDERLTKKWLMSRIFWEGFGMANREYQEKRPPFKRLGYDLKQTLFNFFNFIFNREPFWDSVGLALQYAGRFFSELRLFFK